MLIGYSFWGFLGPGVIDTPDGGRSHRRTLIDGLRARGHQVVFLQPNRDLTEAGYDLTGVYRWDDGFPDIDALFLEWRWPIPGRNTTACDTAGHTCDLHRQLDLVGHYTQAGTPTLLWDKDRQLPAHHQLRTAHAVTVFEPALRPSPGAVSLLFPVADAALDNADPAALAAGRRDLPLVYIGNRYDRDDAFDRFFAPAARVHPHRVAGKWTHTEKWPDIEFTGRIPFTDVYPLYRRSLSTIVLLPERYRRTGHMTQRLFETVLAGCLPLTPTDIADAAIFTPESLHVRSGVDAAQKITDLRAAAGTGQHRDLLHACLERLNLFRLSRHLDTIDQALTAPAVGKAT